MNYEIVFTDNEPSGAKVVIGKNKMTIFVKKDENSKSDFDALKSLSDKDW